MIDNLGVGEFAALGAAIMWTISTVMWGRIDLSAIGMNLFKNTLATIFLLLHLAVLAVVIRQPLFSAPLSSWWLLSLSGFVGIVLGDTFYFRCIQILGPRRALMMASTGPLFAVGLGWLILDESLGFVALLGILITVSGIVVVVADRNAKNESPDIIPGKFSTGVVLGLLGAICQVLGGILSKRGMAHDVGYWRVQDCDPVEAAFIRLFFSAIVIAIYLGAKKQIGDVYRTAMKPSNLKVIVPATAMGAWLGIWFSQIAFNQSPVAIAQTLHSTCPLFAIPIVWFYYKQKISWYSVVGTIFAIVGIYLFLNK